MATQGKTPRRAAKYTADLALLHGTVFTGNPTQKRAQAVAIKGNRIIAVGSDEGVLPLVGKTTRVLDLGGRFVCAGFNDAHMHLVGGGLALGRVELRGSTSHEELRLRIEGAATALPDDAWLQGRGWDQSLLPEGDYPPLALLEEASGERPAFLYRVDGHTAWSNRRALAAAGIGRDTPNPPGGEIVRGADGEPTGILKESAATLVEKVIPRPGTAEQRAAVIAALSELRRLGITSVSELSPPGAARIYADLQQEHRLTARISVWAPLSEEIEDAEATRDLFQPENPYLHCSTLKAYIDGTLGAHTAALVHPYADAPGELGLSQIGEEPLRRLVKRAHRAGFQVALHAIGDRAVKMALDAIEHVGPQARARRHRIEHAEIVEPGDIQRFVTAGIIASMQPAQLISDLRWLVARLGSERVNEAFPWRRMVDNGGRVIFGSDWPIEPLNPLLGLFGATATLAAEGLPALGLRAEAQLLAEEALEAYTYGPAWGTFEEGLKGTVIAGHLADLAVLTDDPTRVPPEQIPTLAVDYTIFDGKVVHARESSEASPSTAEP